MKEYILTNTVYNTGKQHTFYGVALIDTNNEMYELIEEFNDLTENVASVRSLIKLCNNLKLDESQFRYIIEDFLIKCD